MSSRLVLLAQAHLFDLLEFYATACATLATYDLLFTEHVCTLFENQKDSLPKFKVFGLSPPLWPYMERVVLACPESFLSLYFL